ncbi:MAG: hypothetical protein AB1938_24620 [Myxococcota bacterium]
MSKGGFDAPPSTLSAREQLARLVREYGPKVAPGARERVVAQARQRGLEFRDEELTVFAALDTPDKVQAFLDTEVTYNNDHTTPDQEETAWTPRQVLARVNAHCFEGAMFAYAVNTLHGHEPRLVLLEASQDSDHNLVVWRDARTGLFGCNAHSAFPHLNGRPARFADIRTMGEDYHPHYYSDRSRDPSELTLVGYSEPIDLEARHGAGWMASETDLWELYFSYIDETVVFHYLFDDSGESHRYPAIRALEEKWLVRGADGKVVVAVSNLPKAAQELWAPYWAAKRRGEPMREWDRRFRALTGLTPVDLEDNALDLAKQLALGARLPKLASG